MGTPNREPSQQVNDGLPPEPAEAHPDGRKTGCGKRTRKPKEAADDEGDGGRKRRRPDEEPEECVAPWIRDLVWDGDTRRDLEVDGWGVVYYQGTFYRYAGNHYVR